MSGLIFYRRGELVRLESFAPDCMLLDFLRLTEKSKGSKEGCNEGDCGACTVVLGTPHATGMAYHAVNACILLLGQIHGKELIIPYAMSDYASTFATVPVADVLGAMTRG